MSEKLRSQGLHALLSMLLTAGLLLPMLGILEPSLFSPGLLIWSAGIILLFELASSGRTAALVSAGICVVLLLIWMFALDGLLVVSDVVLAIGLRCTGIRTAIPLVASQAALMLTVLVTVICCFSCLRLLSVLPSFMLCCGMALAIYLSGAEEMIPWFLPALAALLLLLIYSRFPETSLFPLFPLTALLIAAAFLFSGSGFGSAPLREKADEIRQAVLDRLFFTEPRDVFSLSSEGFYPEGQDQLGGKPDPSDRLVMQVSTPRSVYLRGVVFNDYTGRSWRNTTGGRRYLWQSPRLAAERAAIFDEDLPSPAIRNALCTPSVVSVRMLSDSASTVFVPQRIRELNPGGELVPYFSNSSELFITRNLTAGDTYSVSAPLFTAGDPGLSSFIEVCSTMDDPRYGQIQDTYTSLPGHLEEPVYQLARDVTSVAAAPYEKALALQSWLSRSFRYTLDVADQPGDVDFVTRFLLDTREGYCTYFASAMTVLCRMIGLPARYVEGYLAEPDQNGEAYVTGLSAHAWTEVYFHGFGWLTFDATPKRGPGSSQNPPEPEATPTPEPTPSPTPTPTPEPPENEGTDEPSSEPKPPEPSDEPSPEPSPEPSDEPSPEPTPDPGENPDEPSASPDPQALPPEMPESGSFPWLWLLLILLVLAVAGRILCTSPSFRSRRARSEEKRFDIWIGEITDLLRAENMVRRKDESPMAFGRRVDQTGIFSVSIGPVGECLSLIRYSTAEPAESDTALVRDSAVLLKSELSRPARLRYWLRRFF